MTSLRNLVSPSHCLSLVIAQEPVPADACLVAATTIASRAISGAVGTNTPALTPQTQPLDSSDCVSFLIALRTARESRLEQESLGVADALPTPTAAADRGKNKLRLSSLLRKHFIHCSDESRGHKVSYDATVVSPAHRHKSKKDNMFPSSAEAPDDEVRAAREFKVKSASAVLLPVMLSTTTSLLSTILAQQALDKGMEVEVAQKQRWSRRRLDLCNEACIIADGDAMTSSMCSTAGGLSTHAPSGVSSSVDSPKDDCGSAPIAVVEKECDRLSPTTYTPPLSGRGKLLHEVYKEKCFDLGVRSQRSIVDALKSLEHQLEEAEKRRTSVTDESPLPTPLSSTSPPTRSFSVPSLDVSMNVLGPRGFLPLLDVLYAIDDERAALIQKFVFASCGLTDKCIECLGLCLGLRFHNLQHLDVSDNPKVGVEGGNALLELVLHSSSNLVTVVASGTSMRPATLRGIDESLSTRWRHVQ